MILCYECRRYASVQYDSFVFVIVAFFFVAVFPSLQLGTGKTAAVLVDW